MNAPLKIDLPVPPNAPLAMPEQKLNVRPDSDLASSIKRPIFSLFNIRTFIARGLTFLGALALTLYACYEMVMIVSLSDVLFVQWLLVAMFTVTFGWIALAATSAITGVLFGRGEKKQNFPIDIKSKVVLLMPVYNEDSASSFSALGAMAQSLYEKNAHTHFEIFVISDTNQPDVWIKETAALYALRKKFRGMLPVWYRRRDKNTGKKAGNVADFIKKWGARYDHMLVLDADSLLDADTMITLVREMEADETCGILQTVPKLCGGKTLLARLQQFAGFMYGDIVARGIAAWQGNEGNYWGHNALIRVRAFAGCAGLPMMPGRKPFGGEVLSHDFVEAALICRAGYSVRMLPYLSGSWEQGPPSIREIAVRDRRWSQGNLQHLNVLKTKGLRWPNRAHMLMGVMGYLASPFWLALISVGLVTYFYATTSSVDYFKEEYSLFPTWPIFDSQRMIELFVFTLLVLLLPKIIGWLHKCSLVLFSRPWRIVPFTLGVLVETFFSILFAPIFMLIHTKQIWEILRGQDSGWQAQQRNASRSSLWTIAKQHAWHTIAGVLFAVILFYLSLPMLAWVSPTLIGLVFSIPLAVVSGGVLLARLLRFSNLLLIPEEFSRPAIFDKREIIESMLLTKTADIGLPDSITQFHLMDEHYSLVQTPKAAPRGKPDLARISVKIKIDDAKDTNEFTQWLTKEEWFAFLSHRELFMYFKRRFPTA